MRDPYQELQNIVLNWQQQNQAEQWTAAIRDPGESNIVFNVTNGGVNSEMLRVSADGFYVRGVRIEQDDREAEIVYNNFRQWLTWAQLNRD